MYQFCPKAIYYEKEIENYQLGKELLETVIPVDDRVCLYFYIFIHRTAQVMIIYNLCKCNILQQCNQSMFLFIL